MRHIFPILFVLGLLASSCRNTSDVDELPEFEITIPMAGNQEAQRLIAVSDGVILIGTTSLDNAKQSFLLKTDFNGNTIWLRDLGIGTEGWSVKRTVDNSLILAGTAQDLTGNKNLLLTKTDLNGNTNWQQQFGGSQSDSGRDVIELEGGGFMLIGTTQSFGAGPASMYVIRTDANGNELWSRTFGSEGLDGGSELVEVNGSEVLLLGFTEGFGTGGRDLYLQGVSVDGDSLASFTFGGSGYEESQAIARTSDGGFVMSNHSASNEPNHSLLATKLDINGQVVWEHEFGTISEHEGGEGVLVDSEGDYIFLGRTNSFGNAEQVYFIKTDANGNVLNELNFGGEGDQRGNDIIEHDGSYFICGNSTVNGNSDVLLIKRPM